jgi:hypothetical protein
MTWRTSAVPRHLRTLSGLPDPLLDISLHPEPDDTS